MNNPIGISLFKGCNSSLCRESYAVLLRNVQVIGKAVVDVADIKVVDTKDVFEVNIVIADGRTVRGLNKRFRKVDRATDVLAFPLGQSMDSQNLDGEIWLCPSVIYQNAKKFNRSLEEELVRVLVHGLLHLLGYDHKEAFVSSTKSREEMFLLQEKIVSNVLG